MSRRERIFIRQYDAPCTDGATRTLYAALNLRPVQMSLGATPPHNSVRWLPAVKSENFSGAFSSAAHSALSAGQHTVSEFSVSTMCPAQ